MSELSMMHSAFSFREGMLYVEEVPLKQIAEQFSTPSYVYSRQALCDGYNNFSRVLQAHQADMDALICYAVKANSNLAILDLFAKLGAGFDIVSGGELMRVLAVGAPATKIVFSGVGKQPWEIRAALNAGILCFNVESESELFRINQIALDLKKTAPISLRVNPDVDARTHPYISTGLKTSKFGIPYEQARMLYQKASKLPGLNVIGLDCHIGSQLLDVAPFSEALDRLLDLLDQLAQDGITLEHIDLGGGLGISYQKDEQQPDMDSYLRPLLDRLANRTNLRVIFEPGRSLVGQAGVLLTRVEYIKPGAEECDFAIVDAAMNDLMRPALYNAWHEIVPVQSIEASKASSTKLCNIVGPICETGDFLGMQRALELAEGDLLAVLSAGAYGMVMSSNYNTRARACEVMVDGAQTHSIRRRESIEELMALEQLLPES